MVEDAGCVVDAGVGVVVDAGAGLVIDGGAGLAVDCEEMFVSRTTGTTTLCLAG